MSQDNSTESSEDFNESEEMIKKTVRVEINEVDAEDFLNQLGARVPPVGEIDEIHLVIKR